jgi:hypothetical protein
MQVLVQEAHLIMAVAVAVVQAQLVVLELVQLVALVAQVRLTHILDHL